MRFKKKVRAARGERAWEVAAGWRGTGGPPHSGRGTLPSPGVGHSHANLLLGGKWAAFGTVFRARSLKPLLLEEQSCGPGEARGRRWQGHMGARHRQAALWMLSPRDGSWGSLRRGGRRQAAR